MLSDRDWWAKNVDKPCMHISAGAVTLKSQVSGLAPLADTKDLSTARRDDAPPPPPPRGSLSNDQRQDRPLRQRSRTPKGARPTNERQESKAQADPKTGRYCANRAGFPICPDWDGPNGCGKSKSMAKGRENMCPVHANMVHQCGQCLASSHGYLVPRKCTRPLARSTGKAQQRVGGGKHKTG